MRYTLHLIALFVLVLAGCDWLGSGLYDVDVTTDKTSYTLTTDSLARVRLVNTSTRPVFLPMGSYVLFEQFSNGAWGDSQAWFAVDGATPYIRLGEGERLDDTLTLFRRTAPGRYRFVYRVYRDKDLKKLLPLEERVSAPFDVVE